MLGGFSKATQPIDANVLDVLALQFLLEAFFIELWIVPRFGDRADVAY
jgi:hypothetical protein